MTFNEFLETLPGGDAANRPSLPSEVCIKLSHEKCVRFWDDYIASRHWCDDKWSREEEIADVFCGCVENEKRRQGRIQKEVDDAASLVRAEIVPFEGRRGEIEWSVSGSPFSVGFPDRLPFFNLLETATQHCGKVQNPGIFAAPTLKAVVHHKWQTTTRVAFRAQLWGYVAYAVLFTYLLLANNRYSGLQSWQAHWAWWCC